MAPLKKPASYDDILKLPPHLVGELVDGELIVSPRPRTQHGIASGRLHSWLDQRFADGPGGGWWFIIDPELHLGRNVVVPDVAGWKRERMPVMPHAAWIELAPDWVCEVLSPATAKFDRGRKMAKYAGAGIAHLWLIDPDLCTLEVFRLHADGHWLQIGAFADDEKVRAEPFDAHVLDLARLWIPPAPTETPAL